MIKPLKTVKKIGKILAWLSILVRILAAIKDILAGDNPGPPAVKNDHKK